MIAPKVARPTPAQERAAYRDVTERDLGMCVRCGDGWATQRDHRRNRSQGGLTVPENMQLLCPDCHHWRTTHPAQAVSEGYAVPASTHDPAVYPARRLVYGKHAWVVYGTGTSFALMSMVEAVRVRAQLGILEGGTNGER